MEAVTTSTHLFTTEIDKLFPFYFIVNEEMEVVQVGSSLKKILPTTSTSDSFLDYFSIVTPKNIITNGFSGLKKTTSKFILIKVNNFEEIFLKGQFEYRKDTNHLVFYGSLWVESYEKMIDLGLTYTDFPAHDSIFEIQQMKAVLKNEEEDLQKLNNELSVIYNSPDLFITINESFIMKRIGGDSLRITGQPHNQFLGKVFTDLFFEKDHDIIHQNLNEILNGGCPKNIELFIKNSEREKIGVELTFSLYFNSDLNTKSIFCIIRNINDKINYLEEIKNLASFPNENPNPIFRINQHGEIIFRNRSAKDINTIKINDKEINFEEFWRQQNTLIRNSDNVTFEGIINNNYYTFITVKRKDSNEINIYGANVTEKKESERRAQENFDRLNNFLESTDDVYFVVYKQDKKNNFITSRWPLFFGFNPNIGDVWKQKRECVIDEHKNDYDEAIRNFQMSGSMSHRYKIKNKVSGQVRWVLEEARIKFDLNLNDQMTSGRITDITTSENFKSLVIESEERFRLITESMPNMIWVSNADHKVVYTNQASRDFFGFDMRDLKGQEEFKNLVHPDYLKTAIDDWSIALHAKNRCQMQYLVKNKKNEYRWIDEIAVPRFTPQGEFLGYIGSALDITTEKNLFTSLEEEKKKYQLISDNSADIIFLLDESGKIEFVSQSVNRILGYTYADLHGKIFLDLIDENSQLRPISFDVKNQDESQNIVSFKINTADGESKWVEAVYNRFAVDQITGSRTLVHVRNINDQYLAQAMLIENEARYRKLFSNMNLGIMEVDTNEHILYVNPAFERISGYQEAELLGKIAPDIFITDLSEKEVSLQERRNREHGKEGLYEIKVKRKDGKDAIWVISGAPTYDLKGKIRGSIGIHWDVTDIRGLESKLLIESVQKEKELMEAKLQAEEEQRDLIGKDLHDGVGQMLAYLSLYINLLKERGKVNPDDLDKAQATLKRTIDEVRRLSRNLAPPAIKDLGFKDAVIELIGSYSIIVKPKFNLKIYKGQDPEKFLYEHKIMLFRVIQELSSNTFKYAKAESADIKIEHSNDQITLYYKDNGVGFNMDTAKKGIGLKSILSRVEFYGGQVKLKSKEGQGTEVLIKLPLQ